MFNKSIKILLLIVVTGHMGLTYSQVSGDKTRIESKVYKQIGWTKLKLYIVQPTTRNDSVLLPAIVFFHGGGWGGGHASQFLPQCRHLAELGLVTISAEYRVRKRQGVTPFECVADAKSAIRWVRANAIELNIDENHIAAGGGSAGGHLAACTALVKGLDEIDEDLNISSVPDALVLFNPVLDVPEIIKNLPKIFIKAFKGRETEISPIHHITASAPPAIIFHGTLDNNVPFHQATRFCEQMLKYGNNCEVIPFEGRGHGFFNYNGGENPDFITTMKNTERFLTSIGYLKGETLIKH